MPAISSAYDLLALNFTVILSGAILAIEFDESSTTILYSIEPSFKRLWKMLSLHPERMNAVKQKNTANESNFLN